MKIQFKNDNTGAAFVRTDRSILIDGKLVGHIEGVKHPGTWSREYGATYFINDLSGKTLFTTDRLTEAKKWVRENATKL